jgi:hypothetical protein
MGEPAATERVSSGIKRKAASVATTLTSSPASLRRRITPGVLYAAMPPVIPTSTLATRVVYRGVPGAEHGLAECASGVVLVPESIWTEG